MRRSGSRRQLFLAVLLVVVTNLWLVLRGVLVVHRELLYVRRETRASPATNSGRDTSKYSATATLTTTATAVAESPGSAHDNDETHRPPCRTVHCFNAPGWNSGLNNYLWFWWGLILSMPLEKHAHECVCLPVVPTNYPLLGHHNFTATKSFSQSIDLPRGWDERLPRLSNVREQHEQQRPSNNATANVNFVNNRPIRFFRIAERYFDSLRGGQRAAPHPREPLFWHSILDHLQPHIADVVKQQTNRDEPFLVIHARIERDMREHQKKTENQTVPNMEQILEMVHDKCAAIHKSSANNLTTDVAADRIFFEAAHRRVFVATGDDLLEDDRAVLEKGTTPWGAPLQRLVKPQSLDYLDRSFVDMLLAVTASAFVGYKGSTLTVSTASIRELTRQGTSFHYGDGAVLPFPPQRPPPTTSSRKKQHKRPRF